MEPTLAPGTRIGGYEIADRIGVGGFGEVYRATQPVIGREVAIKILHAKYSTDPVAIARFVSEARAVNQIAHPRIVEVFDFGEHAGRQYLVMELLAGQTLRELLEERGALPLAEALPILRAIADAVDAAHAVGIAHRDLKPDNVFVAPTKLIDFGIAKLGGESATLTETGSMLGTPLYMSPEQCRGRATDTRTDQYSFGALAYHALVGEPPFGGDPLEVALHHLNDRPVAPSKRRALPARVDRALLASLAKDPALRPASCGEVVAALAGDAVLKTRWSRRTKLAIAAVPLVVGGVVAAIALSGGGEEMPASRPVVDCPSSRAKLGGVWSPTTGELITRRFAGGGDDARVVGSEAAANLDRFARDWGDRWDRACAMRDHETDPLLHYQRLTCLDNALLDLRAAKETLMALPIKTLTDAGFDASQVGWTRGRLLDDCGNERVLRVQVPAPREAVRDRLSDLYLYAARADLEAGIAFGRRDTPALDRALDRLASIARDIEAIDAPSAAAWIADRALMLAGHAFDTNVHRLPAARAALLEAIHRIEASGDPVALANATVGLAELELQSGDGDVIAKATAAIEQATGAVVRAGSPVLATATLARIRGRLAMLRGHHADAIGPLREALAADAQFGLDSRLDAHRSLATSLIANGQSAVALADARRWYEDALREHDPTHQRPAGLRHLYAMVQEATGDNAGALATRGALTDLLLNSNPAPHAVLWDRLYKLELELRLGKQPADADDAIRKIAGLGTTPPHTNPDGIATARRAGMFAIYAYAADRPGLTGEDERIDQAATLAFQRGDRVMMAKLAARSAQRCAMSGQPSSAARPHGSATGSSPRLGSNGQPVPGELGSIGGSRSGGQPGSASAAPTPVGCTTQLRFSRWLALLANPSTLDTGIAALEREYGNDQFAIAYSGIMLASVGRWKDARVKLEAARGIPNLWESQSDLTELDGWLGLARAHEGDLAGARPLFEEGLLVMSIYGNGFDGFSYMTPAIELALADILWTATDGDRPRARRLVEHAIAGFTKLGPGRDTDRAAATRWLADHSL